MLALNGLSGKVPGVYDFPRAAKRFIHDQADAARAPTAFRAAA
jgi:hypothetical protein